MTESLPEPQPATDGQRELTAQERADQIIAAVNEAMPKTVPLVEPPAPRLAPPPVEQPGAPAMSPRETQVGKVAVYIGAGVSMPILASSVLLVATERANPDVIAWCAGGVGALAAMIAALGFLVKRIVAAAPPGEVQVHHHYGGPVEHKEINVENVNKWGGRSSTSASN